MDKNKSRLNNFKVVKLSLSTKNKKLKTGWRVNLSKNFFVNQRKRKRKIDAIMNHLEARTNFGLFMQIYKKKRNCNFLLARKNKQASKFEFHDNLNVSSRRQQNE